MPDQPLRICFAAAEAVPYAKTGGLGDVASALPRALHRLGHDVRAVLPLHRTIDREAHGLTPVEDVGEVVVELAWRRLAFSVWSSTLGEDGPPVYFVDCPAMFDRDALYGSAEDEPVRFALFSRAVVEICQRLGWAPQVFHCNDWHTALLPLLLRTVYEWDRLFAESRTLLTIHNLGYQGAFPAAAVDEIGLAGWRHLLDQDDMRRGMVNFLKTGLIYGDVVSTVSPTYAREIQGDEYGMGLGHVLRARRRRLVGILNGVDYDEWSPERDRHIPHRYSAGRLAGKTKNKRALLERTGLDPDVAPPLCGIVSRLVHQKGFDLCTPVLPELLARSDLRLAVLGSGEERYETFFAWLERRFPGRVLFFRGYNEELAHLIEAGADMFLMPSRYEPCGMNQMFSLRYGTVPVVRRTGGLADSVRPFDPRNGEGTGFVFEHFSPDGLAWALDTALAVWRDRTRWRSLMRAGMAEDFSWTTQAGLYERLYAWLVGGSR